MILQSKYEQCVELAKAYLSRKTLEELYRVRDEILYCQLHSDSRTYSRWQSVIISYREAQKEIIRRLSRESVHEQIGYDS
jgi:hypothetical protein